MKIVFLLAFVGLASCRVAFRDRDEDFRIKYSYDDDDYERDVDFDDDDRPRLVSSTFIRREEPVRYVQVETERPRFRTEFVEAEAARPVYTNVVPVRAEPAANVVTQYFRAEPNVVSSPVVTVPVARGVGSVFESRPRSTFITERRDVFRPSDDNFSREDK
ncbi:uncharacterized protein [Macrobrachium rosenbergii]|uniref:uncharacterized protein n=1 Tax=Macrobrachium rosenbergii TaxID=79674 RepID=UPI0034D66A68